MKAEVWLVAEWRGATRLRGEVDLDGYDGWVCVDKPEALRANASGFKTDPPVWTDVRVKRLLVPTANVAGVEF